jgi:hypothetical protein
MKQLQAKPLSRISQFGLTGVVGLNREAGLSDEKEK